MLPLVMSINDPFKVIVDAGNTLSGLRLRLKKLLERVTLLSVSLINGLVAVDETVAPSSKDMNEAASLRLGPRAKFVFDALNSGAAVVKLLP